MKTTTTWQTKPISCTCEVVLSFAPLRLCEKTTIAAYPAMGGGWQALCVRHARKHLKNGGAILTDKLIAKGEKWK